MFLGDLGPQEKKAFLELALRMVSADGKITAEERDMLQDAQEEMGFVVTGELPESEDSLEECCRSVTSPDIHALMLLELASFAYVDSDYDSREKNFLRTIAAKWQLDEISIVRIEEWAFNRVALAQEAAEIMHEVDAFSTQQGAPD